MEYNEPSGVCRTMIDDADKDVLEALLMKMTKVTLTKYLQSHKLSYSGSKKTLCQRILRKADRYTLRLMAPPSGVISIGIALEHDYEQTSKQRNRTVTKNASTS